MRIAEVFNASFDYLLIPNTARQPLHAPENIVGDKFTGLGHLSDADRAALLHILDELLANTSIRAALGNAS